MHKPLLLILILLLLQVAAFAQNPHERAIKKQGEEMAEATLSGNYEVLANYTYPRLVEMMGGKAKMASLLEREMKQLESQGITFVSVTLGTPQRLYQAGNELHCLVPQTIRLRLNAGNLVQESHLLAVSQDKGKNWYFLDTNTLNNQNARQFLPDFNQDLKIPAPKEPEFEDK